MNGESEGVCRKNPTNNVSGAGTDGTPSMNVDPLMGKPEQSERPSYRIQAFLVPIEHSFGIFCKP